MAASAEIERQQAAGSVASQQPTVAILGSKCRRLTPILSFSYAQH